MKFEFLLVLVVIAGAGRNIASGAIPEHEIDVSSIPGIQLENGTIPGVHKMFSGYIETPHVNGTVFTHYWLILSSVDAPTVAWHQGGPGGSSLIGFFTENGPLTLNDFSTQTEAYKKTGIPSVFINPHSWHLAGANLLYVEHPAPTGFSYCSPGPCYWNDTSQSHTSFAFYEKFFSDAYPELASNDFFATGESYAGVLVPTLALRILEARGKGADVSQAPYNLAGFALGNDCPGNRVFTCTPYSGWLGTKVSVDFLFRHGMLSEDYYMKIQELCKDFFPGTYEPPQSDACREILEDPIRPCKSIAGDTYQMGGGYFLYDTCNRDLMALEEDGVPLARRKTYAIGELQNAADPSSTSDWYPNAGQYACGQERNSQTYLNMPMVQKAIHVTPQAFSFSTGLNYTFTSYSLLEEYKEKLIPAFRILQYTGDADPCVPYVGTERWVGSLNLGTKDPWRPWLAASTDQIAGYVRTYAVPGASHTFSFATIRDAGHMVPRYKSKETLHMIKQFLNNEKL